MIEIPNRKNRDRIRIDRNRKCVSVLFFIVESDFYCIQCLHRVYLKIHLRGVYVFVSFLKSIGQFGTNRRPNRIIGDQTPRLAVLQITDRSSYFNNQISLKPDVPNRSVRSNRTPIPNYVSVIKFSVNQQCMLYFLNIKISLILQSLSIEI